MNWQDGTRSTEVDLRALGLPAGQYHVFNYWPRNDMGLADQFVTIDRHLPHELVILLFKPVSDAARPADDHVPHRPDAGGGEAVERTADADGSVTLTGAPGAAPGSQSGEVWFTFPPEWKVQSALGGWAQAQGQLRRRGRGARGRDAEWRGAWWRSSSPHRGNESVWTLAPLLDPRAKRCYKWGRLRRRIARRHYCGREER